MSGNVNALKGYNSEQIDTAREIVESLTKCNSTGNVVNKLQRVLDHRQRLWIYERTPRNSIVPDRTVYVVCSTTNHTEHMFGSDFEDKREWNAIGSITLGELKKRMLPIGRELPPHDVGG